MRGCALWDGGWGVGYQGVTGALGIGGKGQSNLKMRGWRLPSYMPIAFKSSFNSEQAFSARLTCSIVSVFCRSFAAMFL